MGRDGEAVIVVEEKGGVGMHSGESGGVGCSFRLIDRSASGSLRSRLSGIATCHGDSCLFPEMGEGCNFVQVGPSSQTNSSCFSNKGVV